MTKRRAPVAIAIAGCSGSGKTTLAAALARTLGAVHFPLDHYYRDLGHIPTAERMRQNFDDPELIERPLLAGHIATLARGEPIERPVYDFSTHTRILDRTETVTPGAFLVVEGVFALYYSELLPLYNLRVYIDAADGLCLERRMRRDIQERGRTPDSVRAQYETMVRPAGMKYVRPSAIHADLTLDGVSALEENVERILQELRLRGLPAAAE